MNSQFKRFIFYSKTSRAGGGGGGSSYSYTTSSKMSLFERRLASVKNDLSKDDHNEALKKLKTLQKSNYFKKDIEKSGEFHKLLGFSARKVASKLLEKSKKSYETALTILEKKANKNDNELTFIKESDKKQYGQTLQYLGLYHLQIGDLKSAISLEKKIKTYALKEEYKEFAEELEKGKTKQDLACSV